MKSRNYFSYPFLALAAIALSSCATNHPSSQLTGQSSLSEVPYLKVTTDCGTCQVRPNIQTLIQEGYKEAAAKSGAQISSTSEASVTIKEYSDRDDAARFLAGAFAGKDEIRAEVTYQGKKFEVTDYYRNAWLGIDSLAKKIGEMVFAQMK